MEDSWYKEKERAIRRLQKDIEVGYIDVRALDALKAINRIDALYTTSSCSGRITIVDAEWPWYKENIHTVFKSHEKIDARDLLEIVKVSPKYRLWLTVRGPIFHVIAKDLETAMRLLSLSREAGFKHSGIFDRTSVGYLVELISSSQLLMPISSEGRTLIDLATLNTLINLVNEVLEEGWRRLESLREKLLSW